MKHPVYYSPIPGISLPRECRCCGGPEDGHFDGCGVAELEAHHEEHHAKEQEWMRRHKEVFAQLRTAEAQVAAMREALELAAPHHQGGHSKVGRAITAALATTAGTDYEQRIRADERKRCEEEQRPYNSTASSIVAAIRALKDTEEQRREAQLRADERERVARFVETAHSTGCDGSDACASATAAAIRALSKPEDTQC